MCPNIPGTVYHKLKTAIVTVKLLISRCRKEAAFTVIPLIQLLAAMKTVGGNTGCKSQVPVQAVHDTKEQAVKATCKYCDNDRQRRMEMETMLQYFVTFPLTCTVRIIAH